MQKRSLELILSPTNHGPNNRCDSSVGCMWHDAGKESDVLRVNSELQWTMHVKIWQKVNVPLFFCLSQLFLSCYLRHTACDLSHFGNCSSWWFNLVFCTCISVATSSLSVTTLLENKTCLILWWTFESGISLFPSDNKKHKITTATNAHSHPIQNSFDQL